MGVKTEGGSGFNENSFVPKGQTTSGENPRMTYGEELDSNFSSNNWPRRTERSRKLFTDNPVANTRFWAKVKEKMRGR